MDLQMLKFVSALGSKLSDNDMASFERMLDGLSSGKFTQLTERQRGWVEDVYRKHEGDAEGGSLNLVSRGLVTRGEEVPLPDVLKNLPKKPPGRR